MLSKLPRILLAAFLLASLFVIPVAIAQDNTDLTCSSAGQDLEGDAGTELTVTCPSGCTDGSVWGTGTYTDDSSVCTAAIHAGALDENGGTTTVVIEDGRDEYTASEQNGISSSSWGSWGRSFTFTSGTIALSCNDTSIEGAGIGNSYHVSCPAACGAGSIWGTDIYTDDSTICTAAAHAGVIAQSDGGEFTITYIEGQSEYTASEQNGIQSESWDSWGRSFTFPNQLECGQTSIEGVQAGDVYLVECPAACDAGSIWGTDIYTDDSDICTAAVHAGVINQQDGGVFVLSYSEGQDAYPASEQNGIQSESWGSWDLSFTASAVGRMQLECDTAANTIEGDVGTSIAVSCPAACDAGSIWGTDTYTDDSSICTAAAHAGIISLEEGGDFVITIEDGQDAYPASEQNGIQSSSWDSWGRSFTVSK